MLPMTPEAVRNLIEAEPQATAEAETAALLTGRKLWEEPRNRHASHEYVQDLRSYFKHVSVKSGF